MLRGLSIHKFREGLLIVFPPCGKKAFLRKILTFLATKWHFARKFLRPLEIVTHLKRNCQKNWPLLPLKIFINPYPPPNIFGQTHVQVWAIVGRLCFWLQQDNFKKWKGRRNWKIKSTEQIKLTNLAV